MILKSNAEEVALIAEEIGAEVIRGPVRYPGNQPADTRYLVVDRTWQSRQSYPPLEGCANPVSEGQS